MNDIRSLVAQVMAEGASPEELELPPAIAMPSGAPQGGMPGAVPMPIRPPKMPNITPQGIPEAQQPAPEMDEDRIMFLLNALRKQPM